MERPGQIQGRFGSKYGLWSPTRINYLLRFTAAAEEITIR